MPIARTDPYRAHNFRIEIDGIDRGGFRQVSGLDTTSTPIDYREGTDPAHQRRLSGLVTYSPITLQGGLMNDDSLWQWRKTVIDGKTERKNGSIILLDEAFTEVARWNFHEAWPSKWTGPALNAGGNEVAIESLEITHEWVEKA
jgi:phage tail-like protein